MLIKREIFQELKEHLTQKEITLLVGPRQVGKTTLMRELAGHLESIGKKYLFLNLDNEADEKYFTSQAELIEKIRIHLAPGGFVFIDEIQRKKDAGIFLKGIYDLDLPYKFIVSGSGSLELKEKIHESLAGRKRIFEINPVNFKEFANFKTDYRYEDKIGSYFEIEKDRTKIFLKEYLNFGGYPRVILANHVLEKNKIMGEIFRSCVEKDLLSLLEIDRPEAFSLMVKIIASQSGQILNYSKLGQQIDLTFAPLKKYLWYAQKIFLLKIVRPYFTNKQKEITRSSSAYFYDLGLRNFSIELMGALSDPQSFSFVFQNFVLNALLEKNKDTAAVINFWRTLSGAEVDFVINRGREVLPVEVKYIDLKSPVLGKSLLSFVEKYKPNEAWVVNLSLDTVVKIKTTTVKFIPYWKI
ncbi:MAG: ATP-binding protein [Candidatus Nealsonbacteria bacterium DGGOD1a]|nr:MAG: ATP-binding protein [Candidatus Nealsonbacteria bacterium DGGOD1a]